MGRQARIHRPLSQMDDFSDAAPRKSPDPELQMIASLGLGAANPDSFVNHTILVLVTKVSRFGIIPTLVDSQRHPFKTSHRPWTCKNGPYLLYALKPLRHIKVYNLYLCARKI